MRRKRANEIAAENARLLTEMASSSDAVLIGPGMMDEPSVRELCSALLKGVNGPEFVLDAAAFTSLRDMKVPSFQQGRILCKPHFGEMAKFLEWERERVENEALGSALAAACRLQAVVALKGSRTHIVSPEGDVLLNDHEAIGLAISGSGDALAGILAGLVARGTPPLLATAWAVYMHAEAGLRLSKRIGPLGFLARKIPDEIPAIMRELGSE
jgi:ADP-dependent NAD(P)H-hydrate dehydratase